MASVSKRKIPIKDDGNIFKHIEDTKFIDSTEKFFVFKTPNTVIFNGAMIYRPNKPRQAFLAESLME